MFNIFFSLENLINDNFLGRLLGWLNQHLRRWLKVIIILGLLLVSVLIAFVGSTGSALALLMILALPIGVGVFLLFLRWPPLGLLAMIGSVVIPLSGPSNSNATFGLAGLLVAIWIVDMMVRQRRIQLVSSLPMLPLIIFCVVAVLAFAVGQLPYYTFAAPAPLGAQIGALSLFILSAGVFLLPAHQIRDIRWLEWMVWLFLAVAAVYIVGLLVGPIGRYTGYIYNIQSTGSIFWVWLAALSFSQAVFNKKLHLYWRLAIGGLFLSSMYASVSDDYMWSWNSGWVPAFAAVAGTLWAFVPQLGIVGVVAGLLGGVVQFQRLYDMVMVGDNTYSLGTRVDAWIIVWNIAKINPILGLGPANYRSYTPLFPIRGWAVEFNSHSQYVDLIAQTGLLGLACFLWFFGAAGWLGWQLRTRVPEGFPRAYVYGAIGGVIGTLVSAVFGDWVIPFFYNVNVGGFRSSMLSWLFLGGLVAIQQIYSNSQQDTNV
jgi:hypothetical protein